MITMNNNKKPCNGSYLLKNPLSKQDLQYLSDWCHISKKILNLEKTKHNHWENFQNTLKERSTLELIHPQNKEYETKEIIKKLEKSDKDPLFFIEKYKEANELSKIYKEQQNELETSFIEKKKREAITNKVKKILITLAKQ